ncbi:MAG: methylmalonyl-CoA mutase family protein [bacterium]
MNAETTRKGKLFAQFPAIPTAEWEAQIRKDLKGADYQRKLIWETPEGFPVRPYYRAEDLNELGYLSSPPDEFPYIRGNKVADNAWIIQQDIEPENIREANRIAIQAIGQGVGAIGFDARSITTPKDMHMLLEGIVPARTSIHFIKSQSYPLTLELFLSALDHLGIDAGMIKGSLNFDPIGYLLANGDFHISKQNNFEEAGSLVTTLNRRLPFFKAITVDGSRFQDAGSTLVQELAFSLAAGNEYLVELTGRGIPVEEITARMTFTFALGSSFFLEIAKLRAARLLWAKIVEQYKPADKETCKMDIHCITARWNKTIFDPYVNLLRTTTEGMSGAFGGVNSMAILPFHVAYQQRDDFGDRIARNQQLIFMEESYLDKVVDPAAGSYFIENLTDSIAIHAWDLFRQVEEKGGLIECILSRFVQDSVWKSRQTKEQEAASHKLLILGTNQFPNLQETMRDRIFSLKEQEPERESRYKKLSPFRVAEPFEKLRLATERFVNAGNARPAVFLFPIGNPTMRLARTGFSANFFGCAGYRIIESNEITDIDSGVEETLSSGAEIIVICSSDEELPAVAPEIARKVKEQRPSVKVVIAGYPKDEIKELTSSGIDEFIHIRGNLLDTLQRYQNFFGIQ